MTTTSPASPPRQTPNRPSSAEVGGVVIGGDYQGLGIVRSLGRRGIPVCILDDERSISRYSRYATHVQHVPGLRSDEELVAALLALRDRFGLEGWVVYATRDENVAGLSRNKALLREHFRIPTAGWRSIEFAWDKRNTYSLARELGIPIPQTSWPETLDGFAGPFPVALKPAIKEHFFYETKAKAWPAETLGELRELHARASAFVPRGELMLQELIPGDGASQLAYCALFESGRPRASMVVERRRQHPPQFGRASTHVVVVDNAPEIEEFATRFLS
ncbi:MAG: ATP-grasp domain-containing protein, partial [Thermoleophilaceae bacterium]